MAADAPHGALFALATDVINDLSQGNTDPLPPAIAHAADDLKAALS